MELKPCPFCGGEAVTLENSRGWKVQCANRHGPCPVNCRTHYHISQADAELQWNTRASGGLEPDNSGEVGLPPGHVPIYPDDTKDDVLNRAVEMGLVKSIAGTKP